MDPRDILNNIKEIKPTDIGKLTLEDINLIHPSLDLENPVTYFIYLDRRNDLSVEERNTIFKIIAKLKKNSKVIGSAISELMDVADYKPSPAHEVESKTDIL